MSAMPERLATTLEPCDVLLIEGSNTRVSTPIEYLTQSTWSHAALYLGEGPFYGRLAGEHVVGRANHRSRDGERIAFVAPRRALSRWNSARR